MLEFPQTPASPKLSPLTVGQEVSIRLDLDCEEPEVGYITDIDPATGGVCIRTGSGQEANLEPADHYLIRVEDEWTADDYVREVTRLRRAAGEHALTAQRMRAERDRRFGVRS